MNRDEGVDLVGVGGAVRRERVVLRPRLVGKRGAGEPGADDQRPAALQERPARELRLGQETRPHPRTMK
jgi:hypothetical protein